MIDGLFRYRMFKGWRPKKPRGVLRKAKQILREAEQFDFELRGDSNYGHDHFDWDGIGNFGKEVRLITLLAHAKVFHTYSKKCAALDKPFQLFLSLPIEDAGQDAVYLHDPNPNSAFPAKFDDVEWGVPQLESLFSNFLPGFEFVAGRRNFNFIVWAKNVGVPLFTSPSA